MNPGVAGSKAQALNQRTALWYLGSYMHFPGGGNQSRGYCLEIKANTGFRREHREKREQSEQAVWEQWIVVYKIWVNLLVGIEQRSQPEVHPWTGWTGIPKKLIFIVESSESLDHVLSSTGGVVSASFHMNLCFPQVNKASLVWTTFWGAHPRMGRYSLRRYCRWRPFHMYLSCGHTVNV